MWADGREGNVCEDFPLTANMMAVQHTGLYTVFGCQFLFIYNMTQIMAFFGCRHAAWRYFASLLALERYLQAHEKRIATAPFS